MKTKAKKTIERVRFVREVDECPDSSYLGEYRTTPGKDDVTIDRKERGDMDRNQFRYFIAAMSPEESGNKDSVEADYERMERLQRGDWCYLNVCAVASVYVNGVHQTIRSGGCGGIESDSDASYFDDMRRESFAELREVLADLGFSKRAITEAIEAADDE